MRRVRESVRSIVFLKDDQLDGPGFRQLLRSHAPEYVSGRILGDLRSVGHARHLVDLTEYRAGDAAGQLTGHLAADDPDPVEVLFVSFVRPSGKHGVGPRAGQYELSAPPHRVDCRVPAAEERAVRDAHRHGSRLPRCNGLRRLRGDGNASHHQHRTRCKTTPSHRFS